ncbi:MAG: TetR/AcrR family transcriptional regulator [Phycisphaerales bacterium]
MTETAHTPSSKRDDLIEAALRLFDRDGYRATGIDAIIAEAGVAKMTLYKHFASKDDLIVAALERQADAQIAQLDERCRAMAETPRDLPLAIFDVLEQKCGCHDWRGCLFQRAAGEFAEADDPVHAVAAGYNRRLAAMLERFVREAGVPNPEPFADQLLVLVAGALALAGAGCTARPVRAARAAAAKLLADALA